MYVPILCIHNIYLCQKSVQPENAGVDTMGCHWDRDLSLRMNSNGYWTLSRSQDFSSGWSSLNYRKICLNTIEIFRISKTKAQIKILYLKKKLSFKVQKFRKKWNHFSDTITHHKSYLNVFYCSGYYLKVYKTYQIPT